VSVLRRRMALVLALVAVSCALFAQSSETLPADVRCPSVLGIGVDTDVVFCDVLLQREAGLGSMVLLPARQGEATLSFDLHNRHTYSEEETLAGDAYASYTAEVAVATADGEVLSRRFIRSEFRSAADLVDRVSGGAGPLGVKAIAPTGTERVFVSVPVELEEVFIVGQGLSVVRRESRDEVSTLGGPVAIVSNVLIEFQPR
jgi:hypothetical protein